MENRNEIRVKPVEATSFADIPKTVNQPKSLNATQKEFSDRRAPLETRAGIVRPVDNRLKEGWCLLVYRL